MDGLIVNEPYATQLVKGLKDVEYRKTPLPENKKNVDILILNGKYAIGTVQFAGHFYDERDETYKWFVQSHKHFSPYLNYKHKNGCIIWIKDVEVFE